MLKNNVWLYPASALIIFSFNAYSFCGKSTLSTLPNPS